MEANSVTRLQIQAARNAAVLFADRDTIQIPRLNSMKTNQYSEWIEVQCCSFMQKQVLLCSIIMSREFHAVANTYSN